MVKKEKKKLKLKEKNPLKLGKVSIKSASTDTIIKQYAKQSTPLVRPVENRYANPPQDTRSLFFNETWKKEKRKALGGFI